MQEYASLGTTHPAGFSTEEERETECCVGCVDIVWILGLETGGQAINKTHEL